MRGGRFFSPTPPAPPEDGMAHRKEVLRHAARMLEHAQAPDVRSHRHLDTYIAAAQVFIDAAKRHTELRRDPTL
jgi:hypothetical protein